METVAFEEGNWKVVQAFNREDYIRLGRREWCTAREDNSHWRHYKDAEMYVFFKLDKARPQYQLAFFTHGAVEFRDGGNLHVSMPSVYHKHPDLKPFLAGIEEQSVTRTKSHLDTMKQRVSDAMDAQSIPRLSVADLRNLSFNESVREVEYIESATTPVFSGGRADAIYIPVRGPSARVKFKSLGMPLHVACTAELPTDVEDGTICLLSESEDRFQSSMSYRVFISGHWMIPNEINIEYPHMDSGPVITGTVSIY